MSKPASKRRVVATNKKARYRFQILAEIEAGIVLTGTEVKSLREGKCSLQEAYVRIRAGELWLVGAHIPEYAFGNKQNHLPTRERKLLAHRREIDKWNKLVREKGVTIAPLEVYFEGPLVKVSIGLARGKKLYDKRAHEREQTDRRDMDRSMGRRR